MRPIPDAAALRAGDILHHPAFGFATVTRVDPSRVDGVMLKWEHQGPSHPLRVGSGQLAAAYRLCATGGFFAQSVLDPDGLRQALARTPCDVLIRMIHELGEPQVEEDISDWLLQRALFARARLGTWWDAVRPLLAEDIRFVRHEGTIGLAEGVIPPPEEPVPLPPRGTLPPHEALPFAERVAFALARAHDRGHRLVTGPDAVREGPAGIVLQTATGADDASRLEDVGRVMLLVLEQVLGPLPDARVLGDCELLAMIGGAAKDLPFELLAVALDALAREPGPRPADGYALLERLCTARATNELRTRVGWMKHVSIAAGFDTHIGISKSVTHQANQDAFLALGDPDCAIVAVADGISTSNAGTGDLASALCVRALRSHWTEHAEALRHPHVDPDRAHAWVRDALNRGNTLICEAARRIAGADLPRAIPMGTTCVAAVTRGNRVFLSALGDSRAYLIGRHGVALLTSDHDVAGDVLRDSIEAGEPFEHVPDHPFALTRFLGHYDDDFRPLLPEPFTRTVDLLPGEWLVLASDGLSDYAANGEAAIGRLLRETFDSVRSKPATEAAMLATRALVNAANAGGGGDNVTVLALTISAVGVVAHLDEPQV